MELTKGQKFYRKYRLRQKIQAREYARKLRRETLVVMGGKCCVCGFSDFRALQIDHIAGFGGRDRRSITRCYCNVVQESFLNKENKYQLLCANCNWIKKWENNENILVINKN